MTGVIYQGNYYQASLPVRDSLFEDLKRTNPQTEIEIMSNSTGKKHKVQIQFLTLWSVVRHL